MRGLLKGTSSWCSLLSPLGDWHMKGGSKGIQDIEGLQGHLGHLKGDVTRCCSARTQGPLRSDSSGQDSRGVSSRSSTRSWGSSSALQVSGAHHQLSTGHTGHLGCFEGGVARWLLCSRQDIRGVSSRSSTRPSAPHVPGGTSWLLFR